jgi:predicted nucleotidyltransferase
MEECDYIMDRRNRFFIVRGYYNNEDILACLVYQPSENGRYNKENGIRYDKVIYSNHMPYKVKFEDVVKVFKPREKFQERKYVLPKSYANFPSAFSNIGIPEDDIGIFGSYLIGFEVVKDIDFIIYGMENARKLKNNVERFCSDAGVLPTGSAYVERCVKKLAVNSPYPSYIKSPRALFSNKWSTFKVDNEFSTIRFGYKENEIPPNPYSSPVEKEVVVSGYVTDDTHCMFSPRRFLMEDYEVATYFWLLHLCVKNGQRVEVRGNLHADGKTVTIDNFSHYLKVLEAEHE